MSRSSTSDLVEHVFDRGIDLRSRRIFLQGDIVYPTDTKSEEGIHQSCLVDAVIRALLFLDRTEGGIELWINSGGGDVEEMFALVDVLQSMQRPVTTIATGKLQSAAVLVAAAGDKRLATKSVSAMIHEFSVHGSPSGEYLSAVRASLREAERLFDQWARMMGKLTNRRMTWWKKLIAEQPETWLSAKDLVTLGVVDDIY